MIIIPDLAPQLPTDYDGVWERLSTKTRRLIVLAALIPLALGVFVVVTGMWDLGYFAILVAFSIWGPIGGYFAQASDQLRRRRQVERRQFKALEGAELSAEQRRDAVYEPQRRAAIEGIKRRRGPDSG